MGQNVAFDPLRKSIVHRGLGRFPDLRPELLVYFVMSASNAILNAVPRHDVIAFSAGTLPLCLTALRFPQFQIERLQKRPPHANAGGCFAYHPKPSFHADAQHGAPNVCRDGSVRNLNARQGM